MIGYGNNSSPGRVRKDAFKVLLVPLIVGLPFQGSSFAQTSAASKENEISAAITPLLAPARCWFP